MEFGMNIRTNYFNNSNQLPSIQQIFNEVDNRSGGIYEERFVQDPHPDFKCPVCLGIVVNPLECSSCGYLFCQTCCREYNTNLQVVFKSSFLCPVCRQIGFLRNPSRILLEHIQSLEVYCLYKDQGCEVQVPMSDIEYHQQKCEYQVVICSNSTCCNKKGVKKDFRQVKMEFGVQSIGYPRYACSEACEVTIKCSDAVRENQLDKVIDIYNDLLTQYVELKSNKIKN